MAKVIIRAGKILVGIVIFFVFFVMLFGLWSRAISQSTEILDPNTFSDSATEIIDDSHSDSAIEIIGDSQYRTLLSEEKEEDIQQRGPNRRVWQLKRRYAVVDTVVATADVEEDVSSIVEMGSGICYQDDMNTWQITEAQWRQTDYGFVMDKADYQLAIGPTLDSWLEYTVDGITLSLRPAFLRANDGVNSETLSSRQSGIHGYIDPNDLSRLVFEDAFGEGIDLELYVSSDRFHQNVIFHTIPQVSGMLNEQKIAYEIHTELDMEEYIDDGMIDVNVGREVRFPVDLLNPTGFTKKEIRFKQRFMENDHEYEYDLHRFGESKIFDSLLQHQTTASKKLYQDELSHTYLVESLDKEFFDKAEYPVIWDYQTINGYWDPNDNLWYANTTYYISSDLTVDEGELWIEPGAVIKFNEDTKLSTSGDGKIIARGKPYQDIIFTSKYDSCHGESVDTSKSPSKTDYIGLEIGKDSIIEHCIILHCEIGLRVKGAPGGAIQHNHIHNNKTCILVDPNVIDPNESLLIFNNNLNGGNDYAIRCTGTLGPIIIRNNTIRSGHCNDRGVYLSGSYGSDVIIRENIFSGLNISAIEVDSVTAADPNFSLLNDYNGYYDNDANTINVSQGEHDVTALAYPYYQEQYLNSIWHNFALTRDAQGGGCFLDAGSVLITDPNSGFSDPNAWIIHHPEEDSNYIFVSETTIAEDVIWQPNYSTCDQGNLALGYHHPRVDYIIDSVDVIVDGSTERATLTIAPGTVITQEVLFPERDGKVSIEQNGGLKCVGDPFGNGYVTWVDLVRTGSYVFSTNVLYQDKTFTIHCKQDSTYDIQFTKFLDQKWALTLEEGDGTIRDNLFWLAIRGVTYDHVTEPHSCRNSLFYGGHRGILDMFSSDGIYENCTFAQNIEPICAYYTDENYEVTNCLFHKNDYGFKNFSGLAYEESYNVFYENTTSSEFGDLDPNDWAYPQENYAQLLNGDPFDPVWTEWDDRFCLIADSNAVDGGYDPTDAGMCGYTTFVDSTPDANALDVGFHWPLPDDRDGDQLRDYEEYWLGTSPTKADTDGDGLSDYQEVKLYETDPLDSDTDDDDLPDGWEVDNNLDPLDDTGINGGNGDPDGDYIENLDEYSYNLDPWEDDRGLYETQNEYDDAGQVILTRVIEVTQDSGIYATETQMTYDILGRQIVVRQVGAPGCGPGRGADDTKDRLTLTEYDLPGNVSKTAQKLQFTGLANDPNNYIIDDVNDIVMENVYNSLGQLETTINPEGYETSYTYTDGGRVYTITDPNGNVTTNYYDGAGRLSRVVNPLGHSRSMDYDSLGRVLRQIAWEDTNGTPTDPNDDVALMQQWYAYDGMGHVIRQAVLADADSSLSYIADPNTDKVTDFVYDDAYGDYPGMLVAQTLYYADSPCTSATTTYDYDLLGRRTKTTDPAGNETLLIYDIAGRVQRRQQTDINPIQGQSNLVTATEYEYDDFGRLESLIVDPNDWTETQTTEYAYGLSWRVQETKPNGVINTTEYNTFGEKVAQVADADTGGIKQTTEWGYDRVGRQVTITGYCDETDTNDDQTTVYTYDKLGNVTRITYPDSASIAYVYNDLGRVVKRTDQRDWLTYYRYDAAGNLSFKTNDPNLAGLTDPNLYDPNMAYFAESFTYDGLGRQLTVEKTIDGNDISASVFAYNDIGMLTSEAQTLFGGTQRTVSYTYDQIGYRTSTTYPDGSTTITRTNTWQGQIDTLSRSVTELVAYDYLGSRTVRRSYNTTTPIDADYAYDNLGRLTGIDAGASLVKFTYTYETDENNIDKKYFHHRGPTVYNNYDYDDIDRVTRADYLVNELTNVYEAFNMDDLGNRDGTQTLRDGSSDDYSVDTLTNRYNSIDAASLDYDDAGNLTQDKDGYQFTYDYENRITKIRDDSDTLVATMDYDTQGRRVRVYDAVIDSTTLYYYSDNWQVLSEYNGSDTLQAYYVFGNYIDEVLVMDDGANDYFYIHDHLYSPTALLSSAGSVVVERYEYDAYGKATVWNAGLTTTYSASQVGNHILFTGRRLDTMDNGSLTIYHYRARSYDPETGRFMQRDPLGIDPGQGLRHLFSPQMQYEDGMSLYEYVNNSPMQYTDPSGTILDRPGSQHTNVRSHKPKKLDGYIRNSITGRWYKGYEKMQYLITFSIGCQEDMTPFITQPTITESNRVGDVDYIGLRLGKGFITGMSWQVDIDEDSQAWSPNDPECNVQQYDLIINFNVIAGIKFKKLGRWDIFHQTDFVGSKTHTIKVRCCCGN